MPRWIVWWSGMGHDADSSSASLARTSDTRESANEGWKTLSAARATGQRKALEGELQDSLRQRRTTRMREWKKATTIRRCSGCGQSVGFVLRSSPAPAERVSYLVAPASSSAACKRNVWRSTSNSVRGSLGASSGSNTFLIPLSSFERTRRSNEAGGWGSLRRWVSLTEKARVA
ncbi:hypothetical protein AAT19DRAFT_9056 [Rhodotorula toruloides]|uniref:Uncharacterized protein n=1 Tax=Rhodotorula toruloides TaxID=5286 RepID=A0A2T0AJ05_RHOTO|nr:hypothetical protein AAT19DRAFT_9056 [Rhodotorula toruloides]